ncbi:MAG: hypothetical protein QOG90_1852 [Actinomycetota bacterium]
MNARRVGVVVGLCAAMCAYVIGTATIGRSDVPVPGFSGYATGTNIHVDSLEAPGGPRLVDSEVAFSASATNSAGFGLNSLQNEMEVNLQPANAPGKMSSARGSGLELGLANNVPSATRDLVLAGVAEAVAPPNTPLVTKEIGPVPAAPLAYASLLRGQALANFDNDPCGLGANTPLAYSLGYAADAQLLDAGSANPDGTLANPVLATDVPGPDRAVSQSRSIVYAVANGSPGHYGLVGETRETFAPVFISRGTGLPLDPGIVVELLGEWVFRTTALGNGPATLTYTVEDSTGQQVTPTTPIVRISQDGGLTYTDITFQQFFGAGGLSVPASPLLTLNVGEDPRAIATPGTLPDPTSSPTLATNGTEASGAADAVRLTLLKSALPGSSAADVRIGHFESSVSVPLGGFSCAPKNTTTTTSATGVLEICSAADNANGAVTGDFTYSFDNQTVVVPVGTCTGPMTVPTGRTVVTQTRRPGYGISRCGTIPQDRLLSCQPTNSRAVVRVAPGGVNRQTILTITNRADGAGNNATIKICKIAGNGVPVGTNYNFTVGGRAVTVPAGPASQGGSCKILGGFERGKNVTITEQAASGTHVSAITVQPSDRQVSSSTANRTATVRPGSTETVVTFTNAQ